MVVGLQKIFSYFSRFLLLTVLLHSSGCALVLEYPITSASAGVWGTTGKSPAEHAISGAVGEDCEIGRMVDGEPMCIKAEAKPKAEVIDRSFKSANQRD